MGSSKFINYITGNYSRNKRNENWIHFKLVVLNYSGEQKTGHKLRELGLSFSVSRSLASFSTFSNELCGWIFAESGMYYLTGVYDNEV